MMNITEDYVSFEIAKLLKEKGFDVPTEYFFNTDGLYCQGANSYNWNDDKDVDDGFDDYSRPSIYVAMKWLREVHNKIIVPDISLDDRTSSTINHYFVGIWYVPTNNGGAFCYTSPTPYNGYPSFEEACEAAIKYCLENLI